MSKESSENTTHFGYREVPVEDKAGLVGQVFHSVAGKYDLMNDVMSLGTHRIIKRFTVELSALRPGMTVLDLAGGTGDFSLLFAPIVGKDGQVILADINESMVRVGRDRIIDNGASENIQYTLADAENLPFRENTFDCINIAYGLRNVTNKEAALASMFAMTKPGGRTMVLEFSKPVNPMLGKAYDAWTGLWPKAGKLLTGDDESYQYLVESIKMHPDQDALKQMMEDAGFKNCTYDNLTNGIVAIHSGTKG